MNKELYFSYVALSKICIERSYVSIELNKALNIASEDEGVNRALITKIVYGVLEKDISLEYFIRGFVKRLPEIEILILLKMVAFVSKNIRSIPDFALVNEVVEISKKVDSTKTAFVNAVSKKLISNKMTLPNKNNMTRYLSVKYNYPEWVINELRKTKDLDFIEKLISHDLTTMTHIRILTDKITVEDFKAKMKELKIEYKESYYDYTLYVDYSKLMRSELKGYYVAQGLPSIITCNALDARFGYVLDVCSAPGGKTCYLAQDNNVEVYACDIHPHRIDLVKKYAKPLGLTNIKYFVQDGTQLNADWINKFNYVLCDVPCSNLGISRKKPDIFLNKTLEDISSLSALQYEILETSSNYVKRGGILQYSTCTILDAENKEVINKFLANHPDFELTPLEFDGMNLDGNEKMYTFYPHLTNTEGFFIGRMRRK